jgi:hypothetical protein
MKLSLLLASLCLASTSLVSFTACKPAETPASQRQASEQPSAKEQIPRCRRESMASSTQARNWAS